MCGTETVSVYCYCRMPDHGKLMVECSTCSDWFHKECIREEIPALSRKNFLMCLGSSYICMCMINLHM